MSHPANTELLETLYEEELDRIKPVMIEQGATIFQIENTAASYAQTRFEEMS